MKITVWLFLLLWFPGVLLHAELSDFTQKAQTEEKKNATNSSRKNESDSCVTSCVRTLVSEFALQIATIWLFDNINASYRPWPYADRHDDFVLFPDQTNNSPRGRTWTEAPPTVKNYYYNLELSGLYSFSSGSGGDARFTGKMWKFFGPSLNAMHLSDKSGYLSLYQAGGHLSLLQVPKFYVDLYCQASFMRGLLQYNGLAWGAFITVYPVRPISFSLKAGALNFGALTWYDADLRVTCHIHRSGIFASYRILTAGNARLQNTGLGLLLHL